jgi:CDP-4-dehydro-6-deoxyglucose reductase
MAEKLARTRAVTTVAPDVLVCDFECVEPAALSWRAGQFLSVRCGAATDENPARRSYSIASSPTRNDGFELLVKLLPDGVGSALFERLRPGADIAFTGPMGFFVCELAHAGDAVFAVTGTGIAAALPMIEETLARPGERGRVRLFWGMRSEDELYWLDRLATLDHPRFSYTLCLSRPGPDYAGVRGRINGPVLAALPELVKPVFYLVGNGAMVREVKTALVAAGVDRKRQIRQEIFYPEAAG